ncbi:hypothetical protein F3Y22_tig00110258pilonHSYRG00178 [Hibiscus syriacus]|uniref:Uncharacterized protein n=1 Tax=Hibiscus syriacus TaxID=106335 RepID=A0A6A3BA14_HIBSY|nr:hypothetical protein F3Y22_tig00110258pilonHSYRG00178 [Hibiscus syriacus]
MLESLSVSYDKVPARSLGGKLQKRVTITTRLEVLYDCKCGSWLGADKPPSDGQSLAMNHHRLLFFFVFQVMSHHIYFSNISSFFKFCIELIQLGSTDDVICLRP